MQMNFSKSAAGVGAGMFLAAVAFAHPGHAPTDVVAEVSQPLAGVDHFAAFLALTVILLLALRAVVKYRTQRAAKMQKVRN